MVQMVKQFSRSTNHKFAVLGESCKLQYAPNRTIATPKSCINGKIGSRYQVLCDSPKGHRNFARARSSGKVGAAAQEGPSVQILDLIIPKITTGVGGSEAHRRFPW